MRVEEDREGIANMIKQNAEGLQKSAVKLKNGSDVECGYMYEKIENIKRYLDKDVCA